MSITLGLSETDLNTDRIEYTVTHPTALPYSIVGNIDAADASEGFLIDLPVADGYELSCAVYDEDGEQICDGFVNFDVMENQTTLASAILTCRLSASNPQGQFGIDVTFQANICPVIEQLAMDQQTQYIGGSVQLDAVAYDPDDTAALQYSWASAMGTVADPNAASTTYTCSAVGDQIVSFTLSDSDSPCDVNRQMMVTCVSNPLCGNGQLELDEVCDDGFNDGGDLECWNCTTFQVCLDGTVDGTEECDDRGWSAACDADCTTAFCGDGTHNVAAGEVCDPGPGILAPAGQTASCDSDCTAAVCGDGTLNMTAGELCDTGGQTATCAADCTPSSCGDSKINIAANEQCDDGGESATCDDDCTVAYCGDGKGNTTSGEQCDDQGESATCNANCTLSTCGDGVQNTSAGELCDDGANDGSGELGCLSGCLPPASCGNGQLEPGEACDDSGWSPLCDADCTAASCGDSTLNIYAGEVCDPGLAGETLGCNADCTVAICGDGKINPTAAETCDDSGESFNCDSDCTAVSCGDGWTNLSAGEDCDTSGESASCDDDCTVAYCGDGKQNSTRGEQCDGAGESAACNANCTLSTCGDAIQNSTAGELCDDGANDGTGPLGCLPGCLPPASCGNGQPEPGEACDDLGWSPLCDADCTAASCGDSTLNIYAGEVCDPGLAGETASCNADCSLAICGDGKINPTASEACDDGGESDQCDSDCTAVLCGDGWTNLTAGEDCDATVETLRCDDDCTVAYCGDGKHNPTAGELCDDRGESAACNADCTLTLCGDGILNITAGEICDDGVNDGTGAGRCEANCTAPAQCGNNALEAGEDCDIGGGQNATCDTDCTDAICGDGTLNVAANEVCDPGPAPETAACDSDCTVAACGDNTVNAAASEDCDDGGETDTCDSDCTDVSCGDGLTNTTAGEACDESGTNTANCDADCTLPVCGDGHLNSAANEACDDGNTVDNDGCDADCTVGLIGCDITEVTCPAGTNCYPTAQGDFCLATGTGTEGAVCTEVNGCGAGLGCVLLPTDPVNTYCAPLCDADFAISCTDGDPCVDLAGASNMAACTLDSCNLFTQDCGGATSGCYPTFYGNVCWLAGAGAAGSVCADYRDCAEGLTCVDEPGVGSFCREMCDLASPACTDTLTTCTTTSSPDYGACTPTP